MSMTNYYIPPTYIDGPPLSEGTNFELRLTGRIGPVCFLPGSAPNEKGARVLEIADWAGPAPADGQSSRPLGEAPNALRLEDDPERDALVAALSDAFTAALRDWHYPIIESPPGVGGPPVESHDYLLWPVDSEGGVQGTPSIIRDAESPEDAATRQYGARAIVECFLADDYSDQPSDQPHPATSAPEESTS